MTYQFYLHYSSYHYVIFSLQNQVHQTLSFFFKISNILLFSKDLLYPMNTDNRVSREVTHTHTRRAGQVGLTAQLHTHTHHRVRAGTHTHTHCFPWGQLISSNNASLLPCHQRQTTPFPIPPMTTNSFPQIQQ